MGELPFRSPKTGTEFESGFEAKPTDLKLLPRGEKKSVLRDLPRYSRIQIRRSPAKRKAPGKSTSVLQPIRGGKLRIGNDESHPPLMFLV
jgi:hypothetical protein